MLWYWNNNLGTSLWISMKLYHKVPYPKRKLGIDLRNYGPNHSGIRDQKQNFSNNLKKMLISSISNSRHWIRPHHVPIEIGQSEADLEGGPGPPFLGKNLVAYIGNHWSVTLRSVSGPPLMKISGSATVNVLNSL